jgi:nitrogen-specific signal transduction histidine kinase/CheY-like chemotaxis protein
MLESQRMESVGLLAGGIAHDFNNILMGILGYASLAKDILGTEHDAYRMVNTIEQSAERAAALTSQLLAYARGGKLQTVPVDLELLISEMLNIIGSNIPKSITIQRDEKSDLPNIMADPSQIQQVIMNLCLNASEAIIEAMRLQPAGNLRGAIQLRTSVTSLSERPPGVFSGDDFSPQGDYVVLEVSDNGCGMDSATMQRIFEPFFTTKFTGRGLGLAAVQGIVRNHGGTMTVASTPGQGTTFVLYLPATQARAQQPVSTEMLPLEGDETVLIIDDEEVARQLGLLTLANLGYRVLLASNGDEGLEVYRQNMEEISLVLLDVTMPEMGGADVLASLSAMSRKVPVLLTSGYDESMVGSMTPVRYLSGFLQKPYTPEVLARAVREVLNNAGEQEEE